MIIKYLFSSFDGDIEIDPHVLDLPFKLSIERQHDWLRLRDYFDVICSFVLKNIPKRDTRKLLIRSEKHGAYYHVASAEFIFDKG